MSVDRGRGPLAQMGERLLCTQKVASSILVGSTISNDRRIDMCTCAVAKRRCKQFKNGFKHLAPRVRPGYSKSAGAELIKKSK